MYGGPPSPNSPRERIPIVNKEIFDLQMQLAGFITRTAALEGRAAQLERRVDSLRRLVTALKGDSTVVGYRVVRWSGSVCEWSRGWATNPWVNARASAYTFTDENLPEAFKSTRDWARAHARVVGGGVVRVVRRGK
jgi:hypothetical protein